MANAISWAPPRALSSNFASTSLDGLLTNTTSIFVTYDNSSNLDEFAAFCINLGSITPLTGGSVTLRAYAEMNAGAIVPDDIGSVGGGDVYTIPLTTATQARVLIIPTVRLYPFIMAFQLTNQSGATLNATGNQFRLQGFNEQVN
jgi:hypothetical protein